MSTLHFEQLMADDIAHIECALAEIFPKDERYGDVQDAMEYSLLAGGKRLRPIVVLETCRLCGGAVTQAMDFACALEMVHTYSLVHDDLPAMDDDDLRRGRPTNHKVYGEAIAILAGDGLLTGAFEQLTRGTLAPHQIVRGVACLSRAAGHLGMIGGQILDMAGEGNVLTMAQLEQLQTLKTGALISAAAQLGCIAADGSDEQMKKVIQYATCIGRAFQIRDDMLDITSTDEELGKPIGSDAENEKSTFVTALGLAGCEDEVQRLTILAKDAITDMSGNEFHLWLAEKMAQRRN